MHRMHTYDDETEELARAIVAYARNRIASPQPLDRVAPADELARRAGRTIAPEGIGWEEALRIWAEVLAPATISTDHPASVAFVPSAPTKASVLFDLIVGASSTIATGWIDGAGAIWAENEALRWLAEHHDKPFALSLQVRGGVQAQFQRGRCERAQDEVADQPIEDGRTQALAQGRPVLLIGTLTAIPGSG